MERLDPESRLMNRRTREAVLVEAVTWAWRGAPLAASAFGSLKRASAELAMATHGETTTSTSTAS